MQACRRNVAGRSQSLWNFNILHGLAGAALSGLGPGLYRTSVLPSFVLEVGGSNFNIGVADGLQGISRMAIALPAGYLADKWSRRACIRFGSVLQVVANLCLLFAVLSATPASKQAFVLICVSSCMQGVSDGITRGPTIALMDDSCPAGRRGDLYTIQNVIYLAAASWGPVLGALVFVEEGDRWDLDNMKWVIVIGIIIGLPAPIPLCLMDDRRALGRQSEAVYLQQEFTTAATSQNREARELATRSARTACCGLITVQRVRLLLFAGDVLLCVAIGMTVKFFPVFFHVECKQSPVTVQFIFASMSLLAAVGSLVTNKIAKRVGRLQVVIPCFMIGTVCTVLLGSLRSLYTVSAVIIPLFLLRCSMMRSTESLRYSIVADYTPKSERARWKALESVSSVGWYFSTALGGFLIDRVGYGLTFVISGCFQATVVPLWILLSPIVAKESELLAASEVPELSEDDPAALPPLSFLSNPDSCCG